MDEQTHERPCLEVIKLRAEMDAMKEWRDEVTKRLDSLNGSIDKLLVLGLTTLLSIVAGLLYIILNHALLP